FEARRPKDASKIAPVDGVVEIREGGKKGMIVAIKPAFGEVREVEIGKGNRPIVRNGEQVKTGMELTGGELDPHDILKNLGKKELAKYLVKEIQSVYRLQGVKINDKHIELIVRQMLRRVRIEKVGDTQFLPNEQVEQWIFNEENARVIAEGRQPARGEPILLPITKASLSTESFISAASFQETTKVLTIAALKGKIDYLRGLKENVIMGRLIPAGTGLMGYRHLNNIDVHNPEEMNIS
ncbi:MAG: DNA-directed RNA polymerase subunit beta', partial [Myxococcota bacterium]|nr:DNA-directed RNA polymerase subunit beta' [Myxococcota bacterium]